MNPPFTVRIARGAPFRRIRMRGSAERGEADGRKIYNATKGGKLEVFERADYDAVFGVETGRITRGREMTDKLIQIFAEELMLDPADINDQTCPDNTEQWDSLAAMRLVAAIEESFDITLSTAEIMKMRSISIVRSVLANKGVTY